MKAFICILMAALMSNIPHVAMAQAAEGMISTSNVVEQMSRAESEAKIVELISRKEVQEQMAKYGLSKDEVTKRLSSLSDSEIRQLTKQIDQARYGSDVTGILIVVVLVLLIIFLARRV